MSTPKAQALAESIDALRGAGPRERTGRPGGPAAGAQMGPNQSRPTVPFRPAAPGGPSQWLTGAAGLLDGLGVLAGRAAREVLVVLPRVPLDPRLRARFELLGAELIGRGVRIRALGPESLDDPAYLESTGRMAGLGVEILTLPRLPLWMAVADGDAAIVPADPAVEQAGWVFLRGVAPVAACRLLFEQLWLQGAELGEPSEPVSAHSPDRRESEILRLLADGLTDSGIAARTGLSVRTNRRTIADLMAKLGARSRFQAGAEAARRRWI
ncbi:helix-turn-helix transcriptional regulator [Kitasatospora aureofaciens]|uniref:helix-turn-helix transcriptional regulator n=1 Tax=Kitasatospora aureofaciens TaxID=1894 RepID=UPI001C44FCC4|nr:helix-turn-helix transcriptional regulator [Kitasatospora aureofaciens]MBV6698893.1 helix-turn-helix transcriptional regulator [Kitasatospora aureofaciens]